MLMKMIRLDYMNVRRELPASVVMMAGAVIVSLGGDAKRNCGVGTGHPSSACRDFDLDGSEPAGRERYVWNGRCLPPSAAGGCQGEDSFESPHRRTVAGFAAQCGPAADSGRLCRLRWFSRCENAFYGTDGPVSPLHRFFASDSGNLHGFGAASAGFDRQQLLYGYHDPADRDQLHGAQAVQGIGDLDHHPFWRSHLWGLFAGLGLLLEKLVLLHLGGLWLLFAGLGLLWAFAYILYWGCARMMDRKINLS